MVNLILREVFMIEPDTIETLKKMFSYALHRERLVWAYNGCLSENKQQLYIEVYFALTSKESDKMNITVSIVDGYGNTQTFGGKQAKKSKLLSKWKHENYVKLFNDIMEEGKERFYIEDGDFKLI